VRRHSEIVPGYDCFNECKHPSKGNHGIHGDEWHYVVVSDDGHIALALTVYTDIYPPTVEKWQRDSERPIEERRSGTDLTYHVGFSTTRGEMRDYDPKTWGSECPHVGRCDASRTTALGAGEFFRAHGDSNQFEQAESFWAALEEKLAEREGEFRGERVDLAWRRCRGCDGLGVVEVPGQRLVLDFADDHESGRVVRHAVGIVLREGCLPVLVGCYVQGGFLTDSAISWYCLNEVGAGAFDDPRPHLSRTSVLTVSGVDLNWLHREGEIAVGDAVVRLVEVPS
jgi:hypothetical protein